VEIWPISWLFSFSYPAEIIPFGMSQKAFLYGDTSPYLPKTVLYFCKSQKYKADTCTRFFFQSVLLHVTVRNRFSADEQQMYPRLRLEQFVCSTLSANQGR